MRMSSEQSKSCNERESSSESTESEDSIESADETARIAAVDEDLESRGIRAAVAFLFLFVGIGIPVWWKSTEVYRVSLPYSEIDELSDLNIHHKFTINIVVSDFKQRNQYEKALQPLRRAGIEYKILLRIYSSQEAELVASAESPESLVKALWAQPDNVRLGAPEVGSITAWEIPSNSSIVAENVYLLRSRNVVFKKSSALDSNIFLETMKWMSGESHLMKATNGEHQARRRVKGHPSYNLVFTLLNPEATNRDLGFTSNIRDFVEPFTEKLKSVANLSVIGRVLYNRPVGDEHIKRAEGHNVIEEDLLPHLINPAESWLGSYVSDDPSLYFIVYLPKSSDMPVHIKTREGRLSVHNAFLCPGWGGFLIYNPDVDIEEVMTVFVTQLRLLLGLPDPPDFDGVGMQALDETAITDWEVDFLIRLYTTDFILSARQSLQSLAALLAEIRNMVILDEVGGAVYSAVTSLRWAQESMSEGELQGTFSSSKRAFQKAEEAFFHPSMLALLYFPDDQKYAVYVPLFLPVGFPVLMSLNKVFQWYRKKKAKSKEKTE